METIKKEEKEKDKIESFENLLKLDFINLNFI